jgi:hypothetical protein
MGVGVGGIGVGEDVAVGAEGVKVGANTEATSPQAAKIDIIRNNAMEVIIVRLIGFSPLAMSYSIMA